MRQIKFYSLRCMSCLLHILLYTHTKYKEESLAHTRTVFESFISSGPYPLSEEKRREENRIGQQHTARSIGTAIQSGEPKQFSAVQYSTVQYNAAQYSIVQYSTV